MLPVVIAKNIANVQPASCWMVEVFNVKWPVRKLLAIKCENLSANMSSTRSWFIDCFRLTTRRWCHKWWLFLYVSSREFPISRIPLWTTTIFGMSSRLSWMKAIRFEQMSIIKNENSPDTAHKWPPIGFAYSFALYQWTEE